MSNRGNQWLNFAEEVLDHIDNYTVPQYGDMPDDQVEEFTLDDFRVNLKRYTNRIGSNAGGLEEAIRDCHKIAHYACVMCARLRKEGAA